MEKSICELFAGVGGFRLGFERANSEWKTVWFSQWEPGAKTQWAHNCYVKHFGECFDRNKEIHTAEDICTIDKKTIPNHSLLVGGFPCQDYSVAQGLGTSKGIEGKKGVLWWQIRDVLIAKKPKFCLFENVDRLLKSPANQRGRDFAMMLACLSELNYSAEWRVINASDYGAPQRRRRVFIFAYKNNTNYKKTIMQQTPEEIIADCGMLAKAFPVASANELSKDTLPKDLLELSNNYSFEFRNAGFMSRYKVYTQDVSSECISPLCLKNILNVDVNGDYYIQQDKIDKWSYLKGSKKINRKAANGHEYVFSEGPIEFPDSWNKPARTMLTSEGTLNRSSHVVADPESGRLRTLMPIEAERIQTFDDDWTIGMPDRMRFFCMGNALVVDMITRMAKILDTIFAKEK